MMRLSITSTVQWDRQVIAATHTKCYSFCLDSDQDDAPTDLQSYDWRNETNLLLTTSLKLMHYCG